MKTVEERVAAIDEFANGPKGWSEVRAEIAKQLTQQAAEHQAVINGLEAARCEEGVAMIHELQDQLKERDAELDRMRTVGIAITPDMAVKILVELLDRKKKRG